MNKTFEEQVKNQVQYPEYDRNKELQETNQKLQEIKEKINNMKKLLEPGGLRETERKIDNIKILMSNLTKELNVALFKEKNTKNQMIGKIGNLVDNLNR
tara:strand:+ start:157 stop:453 length:297 start_codon:yes stop_codon:yes gene_type:complete